VVGSVLETLGSRGVSDRWSDPVCFGTSHRSHARPPRRTRNSDRPRASDRTMVATESNRLPSFKNRPAQSPRENETKGTEEQSREEPLERSRGLSANSGLDIETKIFSATSRRRSFFVDIPFYRTTSSQDEKCCRQLGTCFTHHGLEGRTRPTELLVSSQPIATIARLLTLVRTLVDDILRICRLSA